MTVISRRRIFSLAAAFSLAACSKTGLSRLAQIKLRGSLRVGLEGTYPPFNFQDAGGHLTGFEVDLANALAAELGVKADLRPAPFAGLLGALESGRIDVVINQISITPARQAKYDFSTPYTVSGIQIIVRKDRTGIENPVDLVGKTVGVGLGTNYETWLRQNAPGVSIATYDDDPTKYADLAAGRIDAVLTDRLVASDFIKHSSEFLIAGPPFATQSAGVAMAKDPELKAAIDAGLDHLRKTGALQQLSLKWFGIDATH